MDPEYFHTSQLTEKSYVYSFGVALAALLTGRMAFSFNMLESDRNLAKCFVFAVKDDRLFQILEDHIVNEGNIKLLKEVANIAKNCLCERRGYAFYEGSGNGTGGLGYHGKTSLGKC